MIIGLQQPLPLPPASYNFIFRHHLALPSEADSHFRAVCRALVTEAVELTSFMEKVSSSNSQVETDSELGQLDIQDWVSDTILVAKVTIEYL